jgi:hypothetical protein
MAKQRSPKSPSASKEAPKFTLRDAIPKEQLLLYERSMRERGWKLAIEGSWSQGPYHSGFVAYYVRKFKNAVWLMKGVSRNDHLDDVTEEDVEAGMLNDDQIQAMWGRTLEEAQNEQSEEIVALWSNAPARTSIKAAAQALYQFMREMGGAQIDELRRGGLCSPQSALAVIDDDSRAEGPDESEHLELGSQRGGEILVCHGDDRPDCFVGWLEKLVEKYRDLAGTAEEQGQDLGRLKAPIDVMDFIQVIGVELGSRPWTGSLISGTWYEGWIKNGTEPQVQANARKVLADLESAIG